MVGLGREKAYLPSLVARNDIKEGETLHRDSIAYKKPGGGLVYEKIDVLIGKVARVSLEKMSLLRTPMYATENMCRDNSASKLFAHSICDDSAPG